MITILLDQNAIEEALTDYIGNTTLGVDLSQKEVSIKLIAGRGDNGLRAEVSIASRNSDETVVESTPEPDVEDDVSEVLPDVEDSEDEAAVCPFD